MTATLTLGVSCLCGGPVDQINATRTPPWREVQILRCVDCGRDLALEVRLAPIGGYRSNDWGHFGTGERGDRVRPLGVRR